MKMELIQHTVAWCKGEIFEGRIILITGLLVAVATLGFWKLGTTPFAKAAIVPVGVLALLLVGTGISMNVTNTKRITTFQEAYATDPVAFAQAEQVRADEFIAWYPRTRWIFLGVAVAGMLLMMTGSAKWKSIGMVLLALSLCLFVIDHFSEERAMIYYVRILEAVQGV